MFALHTLTVLLMTAAGVAIVALVGTLTYCLTDDRVVRLTARLGVLCLGGFHFLAESWF